MAEAPHDTPIQELLALRALPETIRQRPHDAPVPKLAALARRIVEIEGPIHEEEVARRVAAAFDLGKAGTRIRQATQRALHHARMVDGLEADGPFWMTGEQRLDSPVRDRSHERLPAKYLPPIEIRAAAAMIRPCGRIDSGACSGIPVRGFV